MDSYGGFCGHSSTDGAGIPTRLRPSWSSSAGGALIGGHAHSLKHLPASPSIRKASGKHPESIWGGGGDGARRHSWLFLSSCCVCVCPIGFVSSPSSSSPSSSSSSSSIPSVFSSVSYSNSAPFFLLFHFQEFIFHAEIPNRSGKISNSFPTVMQLFPNDFQISCNASTSFIAN